MGVIAEVERWLASAWVRARQVSVAGDVDCQSLAVRGQVTAANGIANWQAGFVTASESLSSMAYGDLATVGPSVTLATRGAVLCFVRGLIQPAAQGVVGYMSVAVSGQTVLAAGDPVSLRYQAWAANALGEYGVPLTLLVNAGVNTFTVKYRSNDGTAVSFANRALIVIPL